MAFIPPVPLKAAANARTNNGNGNGNGNSALETRRPFINIPRCVVVPVPMRPPSPSASGVRELTSAAAFVALQASAAAAGRPVFVLFHAAYCRSCKAVKPKYDAMAGSSTNSNRAPMFAAVALDTPGGRELASRLGVNAVPYVQVYDGARGKIHEFNCAPQSLPRLRDLVARYEPNVNDESESTASV